MFDEAFPEQIEADANVRSGQRLTNHAGVVVICPSGGNRQMLAQAFAGQSAEIIATIPAYPSYNDLLSLSDMDCDVFVIDLDADADSALDLVETLCARKPSLTAMVYARNQTPDLLMASMRAGAREFLTGSVAPGVLADALLRAAARRAEQAVKRTRGKVLVFWGAKGGSGVTTLATNFAIALRRETGGEVALVDLNPQLGDVAVLLGLTPRFTVADAFRNPGRLDEEFVSSLVAGHSSGVSVLAAPDTYTTSPVDRSSVGTLVELLQNRFPYAVIDAGLGLGSGAEALFRQADSIYVVSQLDIPSLRNSQRFISYLRRFAPLEVELVLNRFEPRKMEFDEQRLAKAVGQQPKWRVPNDYATVRRAANTGAPLISEKAPITQVICQMARAACGKAPLQEPKKCFRLFG